MDTGFTRWKVKSHYAYCRFCNEQLEVGEDVIKVTYHGRGPDLLIHEQCMTEKTSELVDQLIEQKS